MFMKNNSEIISETFEQGLIEMKNGRMFIWRKFERAFLCHRRILRGHIKIPLSICPSILRPSVRQYFLCPGHNFVLHE